MTKLNILLRERRELRGMPDGAVAHLLGISEMQLYDLEHHCDEWRTSVPFYILRFYCKLMEVNLIDYIPRSENERVSSFGSPGVTIARYRQRMGISRSDFASEVGVDDFGAKAIETSDLLAFWPFDVIYYVCEALKIDCGSFVSKTLW